MNGKASTGRRRLATVVIALGALVALPTLALGHIERASYWPNPGADTSVRPAAGGAVPAIRSLGTALKKKPPGVTRVVCQQVPSKKLRRHGTRKQLSRNRSIKVLNKSIKRARSRGYTLRASQPPIRIKKKRGRKLRKLNIRLLRRC